VRHSLEWECKKKAQLAVSDFRIMIVKVVVVLVLGGVFCKLYYMGFERMKTRMLMGTMLGGSAVVFCLTALLVVCGQTTAKGQEQAKKSKAVEDAYDSEIAELRLRTESAVKEVNEAEKADIAKAEAVKRNRYREELGYVPSDKILSAGEVNAVEKDRAQKEKAVRAKLDSEVKRLEERKTRALQTKSAGSERRGDTGQRLPMPAPAKGTVTGIVYTDKGGAALVDGEIVRENDTIHDVKVVKILPETVEFEKNGNRWKQRVSQTAEMFWQPPAPVSAPAAAPADVNTARHANTPSAAKATK